MALEIDMHYSTLSAWVHDQIVSDIGYREGLVFVASTRIASAMQEVMEYTPIPSPCVFSSAVPVDQILVRNAVTGELVAKIVGLPTPADVSRKVDSAA